MAFRSVSLIANGLGLNETRLGDGNSVSNYNSVKMQDLVRAATPDCSTVGEIPAGQLSSAWF
jgi:hypothetical protein